MKKGISILGCGWLGLPLGKFLAKNSAKVNGSTTDKKKLKLITKAGMKAYQIDMTRPHDGLDDFFQTDALVITIPPSVTAYRKIIGNTIAAIEMNAIEKVIFISSTAVYPNNNRVVTEQDAENLTSRSGIGLLEIENLLRHNNNFRTTIIRFAGLYGPGREPGRFLAGRQQVKGGNSPVNLIHLDDCLGVINKILERNIWGETFNACAPRHPEKKEFYPKACAAIGLPSPSFTTEPAPFKIISSEKLRKTIAYKFQHPDPLLDINPE